MARKYCLNETCNRVPSADSVMALAIASTILAPDSFTSTSSPTLWLRMFFSPILRLIQCRMVRELRNRAAFPGSSLTLAVTETMLFPSTT